MQRAPTVEEVKAHAERYPLPGERRPCGAWIAQAPDGCPEFFKLSVSRTDPPVVAFALPRGAVWSPMELRMVDARWAWTWRPATPDGVIVEGVCDPE